MTTDKRLEEIRIQDQRYRKHRYGGTLVDRWQIFNEAEGYWMWLEPEDACIYVNEIETLQQERDAREQVVQEEYRLRDKRLKETEDGWHRASIQNTNILHLYNKAKARCASLERVREAVTVISRKHTLDENLGDTTERFETILWIVSNGKEGKDWGHEREWPKE